MEKMLFLRVLQEAPPDTMSFMILGYGVIFVVMGIYVFSLFSRRRKLEQDLQSLGEMD
jgi:CcmD family protein